MDSLLDRVVRFSDRRERQILGFDIDTCIKRKIPPCKVVSDFPGIPYTIEILHGVQRLTSEKFHVDRYDDMDAYGTSFTFTYYYNYSTRRASVYRDGAWDLWVVS